VSTVADPVFYRGCDQQGEARCAGRDVVHIYVPPLRPRYATPTAGFRLIAAQGGPRNHPTCESGQGWGHGRAVREPSHTYLPASFRSEGRFLDRGSSATINRSAVPTPPSEYDQPSFQRRASCPARKSPKHALARKDTNPLACIWQRRGHEKWICSGLLARIMTGRSRISRQARRYRARPELWSRLILG